MRAKDRESANLQADSVWFLSLLLCYGTAKEDRQITVIHVHKSVNRSALKEVLHGRVQHESKHEIRHKLPHNQRCHTLSTQTWIVVVCDVRNIAGTGRVALCNVMLSQGAKFGLASGCNFVVQKCIDRGGCVIALYSGGKLQDKGLLLVLCEAWHNLRVSKLESTFLDRCAPDIRHEAEPNCIIGAVMSTCPVIPTSWEVSGSLGLDNIFQVLADLSQS